MRILLTGVSCIGKTTLGKILAERLQYPFFDLDTETELYFGKTHKHAHLMGPNRIQQSTRRYNVIDGNHRLEKAYRMEVSYIVVQLQGLK